MRRHKRLTLGVLAGVLAFVALIAAEMAGAGTWKVSDSSPCSSWSSANQRQQAAYARLYVREHGPLPGGATSITSVVSAINGGCTGAYAYDEADTVNVLQAIEGRY